MIVLVYPMLSNALNLNADSGYLYLRATIPEILRQRPDWRFVMPFPSNREWKYYPDGFFDDPRIIRVPMLLPEGKIHNVVHYDTAYWMQVLGRYPPDIIWTQTIEVAHLLKYNMECYEERARPVVINQHMYVVHPSLPYPVETQQPHVMLAQLVSSRLVDRNVFPSRYCRWMLDDNIARLWPGMRYEGEVIPFGQLDPTPYDRAAEGRAPYDAPTVIYNHRLQAYKRPEVTFDILARVHARHPELRVVTTASSVRGRDSLLAKYPWMTIKAGMSRDQYLGELSRAHVNMTHTTHETYCLSAVESLAYGQWLIAPNKLTFPELVPAGYPFLFDRDDDAEGMLCRIIEEGLWRPDHPRRRALAERTRAEFALSAYAARYIDLFERVNTWDFSTSLKPQTLGKLEALTNAVVRQGRRRVPLQELRNVLAKQGRLGHQAMSGVKLKRILNELGWRDDPDRTGTWLLAPAEAVDATAQIAAVGAWARETVGADMAGR